MGTLGQVLNTIVNPFSAGSKAGGKTKPPVAQPAPAVGPAPMQTDQAAQTAATEAGINQGKYGVGQTILTSGKGAVGATVTKPGLTTGGSNQFPSIFTKYLGD